MGNYIKEAIARTNLQDIREFLLHGVEECKHSDETFEMRLKKGNAAIYKRLETLCPDRDKLDDATGDLSQALATHSAVYTEMGMKVGARLIYQLLVMKE